MPEHEPSATDTAALNDAPIGWAAVEGDGVKTTTGGQGGRMLTVIDAAALIEAAKAEEPLIIRLQGSFEVPRLQVASNKTLIGADAHTTLLGGVRIRGSADAPVSNVVIRNLRIDGKNSDVDGDAVQIHYAHHVLIDHCEIWDGKDGNLDIVHASNWITVSWTKFHYTEAAPDPKHRFCNLVGHSDENEKEDSGRLKVTFHHDWWSDGIVERMPRVRFGDVHVFNSYYAATGDNYAIGAGLKARIRIENNVFDRVRDPHRFYDDEPTAQIVSEGNLYESVMGKQQTGQGAAFEPPYAYTLDDAAEVQEAVTTLAGPR